ncbi:HDOD domain-containing protein [Leeia sp. TBRC 13508]|uniref:HDOD domain-containing protein n=1 Tax=Leeia speluncae TaxID=2884804 RepID=A0ABS8D6K6_9NEIS|nr:HDOD domain-containing protein [Leeia speluncae]MCB6183777.1 HDOD domain-containing protein [Leeia speluncae]
MMLQEPLPNLKSWVLYFENAEIPVLESTKKTLLALNEVSESLTAKTLSEVVLRDPLMTIQVLRNIQKNTTQNITPITTVAHAIMMRGVERFFHEHQPQKTVEETLRLHFEAHTHLTKLIQRAHIGSYLALLWGKIRHDIESDELVIAALLYDLAEIILCLTAPRLTIEIQRVLQATPGKRSAEAQKTVLGVTFQEIQVELAKNWKLPELLLILLNEQEDKINSRAHIVALANRVARHILYSPTDPALPDDYKAIAELTGQSLEQVPEYLVRILTNKQLL